LGQLSLKYAGKFPKIGVKNSEQNFPQPQLSYSVVRIFHLNYPFSKILDLEASPEEGQQLRK